MADMKNRTTEHMMAVVVMAIVINRPNGCANLRVLRRQIEKAGILTDEDWEESHSQSGKPKWHQILRNINSNRHTEGNFIYDGYLSHLQGGGYCITEKGRKSLDHLQRILAP